jgi:hypothetical protein
MSTGDYLAQAHPWPADFGELSVYGRSAPAKLWEPHPLAGSEPPNRALTICSSARSFDAQKDDYDKANGGHCCKYPDSGSDQECRDANDCGV